jgi:hypothetical protein
MHLPRPPLWRSLLALGGCLLIVGCELGQGPAPSPSVDPSASPIIETESEFCVALDELESEHQVLREIKLRPGTRDALDHQFEEVDIAWDELQRVAPRGMRDQLDALSWAVIDLGLAVEDYTTTDHLAAAADHVLRMDIAFDRAIGRLRARTTCPPWSPTPPPVATPSPSLTPSAEPSPPLGTPAVSVASPATGPPLP